MSLHVISLSDARGSSPLPIWPAAAAAAAAAAAPLFPAAAAAAAAAAAPLPAGEKNVNKHPKGNQALQPLPTYGETWLLGSAHFQHMDA